MARRSTVWPFALKSLAFSSRRNGLLAIEAATAEGIVAHRCAAQSSSSWFSTLTSTSSQPLPSPTKPPTVGFVGLGAMGSRIALNLCREFPLIACDSSRAALDSFVAAAEAATEAAAAAAESRSSPPGRSVVTPALSVSELFQKNDGGSPPAAVLTSLPSPAAVREVWLGEEGLIRRAASAAAAAAASAAGNGEETPSAAVTLVELSTIAPQTALELSAAVDKENKTSRSSSSPSPLRFLSAPVSGGTAAAEKATLTVLAGGATSSLEAASRFLRAVSSRVVHVGEKPGDGDAAKLANNLALAIQMASVSEALALASLLAPHSLSPQRMIDVLNLCSGRCWSSEVYPPLPELRNDYKGGFAAALMLKDLKLAREAAAEAARKRKNSTSCSSISAPASSSSSSSSTSSSLTPLGDAAAVAYLSCPPSEDFSSVFRHFYGGGGKARK